MEEFEPIVSPRPECIVEPILDINTGNGEIPKKTIKRNTKKKKTIIIESDEMPSKVSGNILDVYA